MKAAFAEEPHICLWPSLIMLSVICNTGSVQSVPTQALLRRPFLPAHGTLHFEGFKPLLLQEESGTPILALSMLAVEHML